MTYDFLVANLDCKIDPKAAIGVAISALQSDLPPSLRIYWQIRPPLLVFLRILRQ